MTRYGKYLLIKPAVIDQGERLFRRYGAAVIGVARFIAGLRVIAGPLAGVLRMHWRTFAIFNFLGAVLWVTVISVAGYLFGRHWERVADIMKNVNIVVFVGIAALIAIVWYRRRRSTR